MSQALLDNPPAKLKTGKPRVLVVSDYKIEGGAEKVANQTCQLLASDADTELYYGNETACKPESAFEYVYSRKQSKRLLDKLNAFKPHVVNVHNYYHYLTPSILSALKRYKKQSPSPKPKIVFTAHDYHLVCPQSAFCHYKNGRLINFDKDVSISRMLTMRLDNRGMVYSALRKLQWIFNYKILRNRNVFDLILTPSQFLYDVFAQQLGAERLRLVRYPFETEMTERAVNQLIEGRPLKLVFLGRVDPEKGVHELLDAMHGFNGNEVELTYIGDGKELANIQRKIEEEELGGQVKVVGRVAPGEVQSMLPKFDAMILPSLWYENAPLVIIENALAGLRLIVSKWGGLRELGELCGDAHFFDPNSAESIQSAIQECRQAMLEEVPRTRNYSALVEEFSMENFRGKLVEILEPANSQTGIQMSIRKPNTKTR